MMDPAYQDVPAAVIPIADLSDSQDGSLMCKVLVGNCGGTQAVIETQTPVQYLDFRCKQGSSFSHSVPSHMDTCIIYVYHGKGVFNGEKASDGETMLLSSEGSTVNFECNEALKEGEDRGGGYTEDLRFLLLAGKKLKEPIARHGPFVMNTREELMQAFMDYQNGQLCKKRGTMKQFEVRSGASKSD